MVDISDEKILIERALNDDQVAWSALVRQHQQAIFQMAYLVLRNADNAEDVAQETFIRAFRALDKFDSSRPLRPWLLKIAKNLAYNQQRSLRRYLAALQRWFETQPTATEKTSNIEPHSDQVSAIHSAIVTLKQTEQEIIYLRYFLELSVDESAEVVGVATGTVKSRLSRALNRLREIVESQHADLLEESLDEF